MNYSDRQREKANISRFTNILSAPAPWYPIEREKGFIVMLQNGRWTFINIYPVGSITQWRVDINGDEFSSRCGMNKVYRELARRNPPARNFY